MNRKTFLTTTLGIIGSAAVARSSFPQLQTARFKAIAFDAFPIFDVRPAYTLAEELFPGKGNELSSIWRTTQFEYCWLRTAAGQYRDFLDITRDALLFASKKTGVPMDSAKEERLIDQYMNPDLWPDVWEAMDGFSRSGIRLCFLSNLSPLMLGAFAKANKLDSYFEELISTSSIHSYKPDPKAYRLAIDVMKLKKEEILFTASAGWDACGAKWFGYPTFWMNRVEAPPEELQVAADGTGKNMDALVRFMSA